MKQLATIFGAFCLLSCGVLVCLLVLFCDRKWKTVVLLKLLLVEFVVVFLKIGSGILKLFRYFCAIGH